MLARLAGSGVLAAILALCGWIGLPSVEAAMTVSRWTGLDRLAPLDAVFAANPAIFWGAVVAGLGFAGLWRTGLGLCLGCSLALLGWLAVEHYATFQRLDRLTGLETLRPARAWLAEFRVPLLAAAAALLLSWLSSLWHRLGLGH